MAPENKAKDLIKKHNGKDGALITVQEILRLGGKLKNEYVIAYYSQVKKIIKDAK